MADNMLVDLQTLSRLRLRMALRHEKKIGQEPNTIELRVPRFPLHFTNVCYREDTPLLCKFLGVIVILKPCAQFSYHLTKLPTVTMTLFSARLNGKSAD